MSQFTKKKRRRLTVITSTKFKVVPNLTSFTTIFLSNYIASHRSACISKTH